MPSSQGSMKQATTAAAKGIFPVVSLTRESTVQSQPEYPASAPAYGKTAPSKAASKATVTPLPTASRASTQPLFEAHANSAKETKPTGKGSMNPTGAR
ncbi:hypothetical protein C2845_PM14G09600 [Panicum miliaceum]|uniref:Uncharacterized protein n=1 Tax=Panicum miliaceum TaxID=4540 RepID=A0A3L6PU55_PANMI|nr:hypothetical protein C2845_PM14G09600 [Panicum miliaceum]